MKHSDKQLIKKIISECQNVYDGAKYPTVLLEKKKIGLTLGFDTTQPYKAIEKMIRS